MIVLETLDPRRRIARFREVEGFAESSAPDRRYVDQQLQRLGVTGISIEDGPVSVTTNVVEAHDANGIEHRWRLCDGHLEYEASFRHEDDAGELVSLYTPIALATYGSESEGALTQLRLAIYEMCMNITDHGVPCRDDAAIELGLRFRNGYIEGWVQDECEAFNPLERPVADMNDHIRHRARRGYGLMMVRLLLDDLRHEFNETGNRLHFSKRIEP